MNFQPNIRHKLWLSLEPLRCTNRTIAIKPNGSVYFWMVFMFILLSTDSCEFRINIAPYTPYKAHAKCSILYKCHIRTVVCCSISSFPGCTLQIYTIHNIQIYIFIFMDFDHRIKFMHFYVNFLIRCILAYENSLLSSQFNSTDSFDSVLVIKINVQLTDRCKLRFCCAARPTNHPNNNSTVRPFIHVHVLVCLLLYVYSHQSHLIHLLH